MPQDRVLVTPLVLFVCVTLAAAGAALFMSVRIAHAETTGNCTASIDEVDIGFLNSGDRSDDIEVSQDERVSVGAQSPVGFKSHKIQLEFGSRRWTVSRGDDDGANSWSGSVNVDDYSRYGVGLYKVIGVSVLEDKTICRGVATVDVSGNPLATVAGAAAAGAAVIGTLGGLATASVAATRKAAPLSYDLINERESKGLDPVTGKSIDPLSCAAFAAISLIMIPLYAMMGSSGGESTGGNSGAGEPEPAGSSTKPRGLPRAPWRPRITLLGLISGFLAGAGVVVLLQQYSIQYPTLAAIITWVVIGMAAYGFVLPTLGNTIRWWRINGRISRLEKEAQ